MSDAATLERPTPGIGDNSASVGEMIKAEPAVVYRDDTVLPAFLDEIRTEIAALKPDLSTASGRDAIASLAYSIARRKTPIVDAGLALTEDWRKRTTAVNALKSKVVIEMDALRDLARAPLDKWETAEKARKDRIVGTLTLLSQAAAVPAGATVQSIDVTIAAISAIVIGDDFGDSAERATTDKAAALAKLAEARAAVIKADEDRAELDRLRAEARQRELEAQQAEARRQAEEDERRRIADAERRATEAAEAKVKAEADAAIATERRKAQEAEQALADEQRRQREAAEAEAARDAAVAAEDARRQANVEHQGNVMRAAKEALIEHGGLAEAAAKKVVLAIRAGTIPAVTLKF